MDKALKQFIADTRQVFGVELKSETLEDAKRELAGRREELEKKSVRAARLSPPETLDEEARTVDCVIATERPVIRFDWEEWEYYEEVLLAAGCDLSGVKDGIPFIDGHRWDGGVSATLGTTVDLRIDGDKVIGTRVFANTRAGKEAFSLIKDGHLRKQSIGYRIDSLQKIKPGESTVINGKEVKNDGKRMIAYAVKWTPLEDSAVIVPADIGTGVKSDEGNKQTRDIDISLNTDNSNFEDQVAQQKKGVDMTKNKDKTTIEASASVEPAQAEDGRMAIDAVLTAERERTAEINALCDQFNIGKDARDGFVADGKSIVDVRKAILSELASRTAAEPAPPVGRVSVEKDHMDAVIPAMRDAILMQGDAVRRDAAADGATEFIGMSAREFAAEFLEQRGERVRRGTSDHELMQRLMMTTDFPLLLEDAAVRGVQFSLQEAEETYKQWADTSGTLSDLKPHTVARLTEFMELEETKEGEESKYDVIGETGQTVKLTKYTKMLAFTEETMINDSLGEFAQGVRDMGKTVARLEGDLCYDWLISPPDIAGTSFFNSAHGNLAGTSAAMTEATIGAGITAMTLQMDVDGKKPVSIRPRYLITPVATVLAAKKILMSQVFADGSTAATQYNTIRDMGLQLVSDHRIDAYFAPLIAGGGKYPWFLLGAKGMTVKLFYLKNQREPVISRWIEHSRDAITVRIKHRVASHGMAYQAFYKNVGA